MLRIVDSGSMSAFEMWVAKVTHPVRLATSPTGKAKGVGDQNCDGTGRFSILPPTGHRAEHANGLC